MKIIAGRGKSILVRLLVYGGILFGLPFLFLYAMTGGFTELYRMKVRSCANNLAQLWKMQYIYSCRYGGKERLMPHEIGDEFWLKFTEPDVSFIEKSHPIFVCPVPEGGPGSGRCAYRGPKTDANLLPYDAIVGCDKPGNHGEGEGINVLFKSGDVQYVMPDGPLYQKALEQTCE